MVLFLCIVIGAVCGIFAAKRGFYSSWALLVNVSIAVYLGVFLTPTVFETLGSLSQWPYALATCLAVIAVVTFLILHSISFIFFTGQFRVSFPRIINTLGAGLLGFLSGFIVCGFVSLVIAVTPICQKSSFSGQLAQTANLAVVKSCNCINLLSCQSRRLSAGDVVGDLLYTQTDNTNSD